MRINRFFKIAKKSTGYFFTSAFAVYFLFSVLAAASIVVAPYIALPVIGGVGLIFALAGARNAKRNIAKQEQVAKHHTHLKSEGHAIKSGDDAPMKSCKSKNRRSYSEDSGRSARAIYAAMHVSPADAKHMTLADLTPSDPDFRQPIMYQRTRSLDLADGRLSSVDTPQSIVTEGSSLDTVELLEAAAVNSPGFTAAQSAQLSRQH